MKMASDTTHIAEPLAAHTHTVIFLHGRDSNSKEFADEVFESEASDPVNQPRTLRDLFPSVRWVFPSAPSLPSSRFGTDMSQWFDMWSVEDPAEQPELQRPGLEQSIKQVLGIIEEEENLVPRERIFLAGISQGFATVMAAFFADTRDGFAGLIGLCSWMPPLFRDQDYQSLDIAEDPRSSTEYVQQQSPIVAESSRKTPIFLSHSADDEVVPIANGRELRDIVQSRRFQVEWKEYEDGGHWINEPQGVDDIVHFMNSHMTGNRSLPLESWV
ncbi:lysophospholipase II [Hypoxylon argillaceum]|nr:lysophospholipase II [Hypoxylon argillaceum]KAI1156400.1 lysophospholipase II [Nemania diffusa]